MTRKGSTKTGTSGGISRAGRTSTTTCKTCTSCRAKKIKCDGNRPHCSDCISNGETCVYPHDARRQPRPSRARVESLEAVMAAIVGHMKASGIVLPQVEAAALGALPIQSPMEQHPDPPPPRAHSNPDFEVSIPFPSPSSSATIQEVQKPQAEGQYPLNNPAERLHEDNRLNLVDTWPRQNIVQRPERVVTQEKSPLSDAVLFEVRDPHTPTPPPDSMAESGEKELVTGLSTCEARVAGVYHEDGCVSSVHGLTGMMNPTSRETHKANISKVSPRGATAISATQARLISNAALQRQHESALFRSPSRNIDMDGCEPELAKHLLDLHFKREDYPNLILYRPAIISGISRGGGRWVNKLLLNAIFYSSSLLSDRQCFGSDLGPKDRGNHFYERFRHLLVEEMGQPSIPTATAMLLASTSLIARGKINEGWVLSGMAYRMVIDLGCHLMLAPDYQTAESRSNAYSLHRDVDHEMRKRLYWGAYVTDVTQSLFLGRPCMFATVEARVPLRFLDTFEELDDWQPYADPTMAAPERYEPQAARTISTLTSLIRLTQVGKAISNLYDIQIMKHDTSHVLQTKSSIEQQLEDWHAALPEHLQFNPDGPSKPPPHQYTPLTTFHVLRILLNRAFMEEGHLRRHTDLATKSRCEDCCIMSAMMISKYIQSYRKAFTLRRAPFLLSYAVYSAATVILRQERHDRGQFMDTISSLWQFLGELQEGCNFGLQRPMAILRDMVQQFYRSVREREAESTHDDTQFGCLDESIFANLPLAEGMAGSNSNDNHSASPFSVTPWSDGFPDYTTAMDQLNFTMDGSSGVPDCLTTEEWTISQNSLYGLFAP